MLWVRILYSMLSATVTALLFIIELLKQQRNILQVLASGKNIKPAYTLKEFVDALETPRKIMLLVKAGAPVDATIQQLIPLLDKGDLIIDGGNFFS